MYCCFCLYITAHYVLLAGGAGGLNAGNQRLLVGVGGQVLGVFMLEDILEEGIGKGCDQILHHSMRHVISQ